MRCSRLRILVATLAMVACIVLPATADELLYYRNEGAFSKTEATVDSNGKANVSYNEGKSDKHREFMLTGAEVWAYRVVIAACGPFWANPERGFAKDVGDTTIRVRIDGTSHELKFVWRDDVRPIEALAWELIQQAVVIDGIEARGDVYEAAVAVNDLSAGTRVLQPRSLIDPLQVFVHKTEDGSKLTYALEGLAWITSPDEWIGFIGQEFNLLQGQRRDMWVNVLALPLLRGNIPKKHSAKLKEFLLVPLRAHFPEWSSLSQSQQSDLAGIIMLLDADVLPVLLDINPEAFLDHCSFQRFFIKRLGDVSRLIALLDDKRADMRRLAAFNMGNLFDHDPGFYSTQDYPAGAYQRALGFAQRALPRLKQLAESDPDKEVRAAAAGAIVKINKGDKKTP